MKNSSKPLRDWFGYNRRERRATIVLIIIGSLIFSFRYINLSSTEVPAVKIIAMEEHKAMPDSLALPSVKTAPVLKQAKAAILSVEINKCDSAELTKLPGIGPVFSGRIIKFRKLLGGFADKRQLQEVYGIPMETFTLISPMVTVDTSLVVKIFINTCEYRDLVRHPYISPDDASSIMRYRDQIGRIDSWITLQKNNLISGGSSEFLRYYISFN